MDRRRLPAVDQLVDELGDWPLPRALIVGVVREVLDELRTEGTAGDPAQMASARLTELSVARIGPILNATGVLLHTNLGRAPMATEAAEAACLAAVGYTNLELDLSTGTRGKRGGIVADLFAELTGAEATMIVNNNAAALVLAVASLAVGREILVSRGELIEIGGSYRLPAMISAGGAILREVGTTNRTRALDYESAIGPAAAAFLKVHPSNYRIVGFASDVGVEELAGLAHANQLPLLFDAGSGLLDDQVPWLPGPPPVWAAGEPGIRQSIRAGADLVLFSGDKLLGGPQAGVVVGKHGLISEMASHPLARAFRIDGPNLAALEATATMYLDGRGAEVPLWSMVGLGYLDLERRAEAIVRQAGVEARIEESTSVIGGGSMPGAGIPSPVISIAGGDGIMRGLLRNQPPILARREGGRVLLDVRAVPARDDAALAAALAAVCR